MSESPSSGPLNSELLSRRRLLKWSGLGCGSMALASLLERDGLLADEPHTTGPQSPAMNLKPKRGHFPPQATAVIQLVMTGGPSHVDLFDPKPELQRRDGQVYGVAVDALQNGSEANRLMGSPFRFRRHGHCGMPLSELLPQLGSIADDVCLVRSMVSEHNNHTEAIVNLASAKIFIGRPTLGAWISYGLGTENQDLPSFVVLRDPDGYSTSGGLMSKSGWLSALYGGTEFNARGTAVHNLAPATAMPTAVQRRGLEFLARLNEEHRRRRADRSELETRIRNYELAARMQLSATDVLDLSGESAATRKLYGLDKPVTAPYGIRCLMARRLVESGVRFVQVFSAKGQPWDHHSGLRENLPIMCAATDLPSTGLIKDLKSRGLLDSTVVLWAGEFGRMPVAQGGTGRDHNKRAGSLWLAGGGFKGGTIHGETDDVGFTVVKDRFSMPDMFATILHQLGLDHRKLKFKHSGRFENASDDVVTGAHIHRDIIQSRMYI